jgi:hypothetical protein
MRDRGVPDVDMGGPSRMCEVDIRIGGKHGCYVCTVGVRFAYGGLDSRLELKLGGMRDRALWLGLNGVRSQVRDQVRIQIRNQVRGVRSGLGPGRGYQAHNRVHGFRNQDHIFEVI